MEDQIRKYQTYERKLKFMLACSGLWPNYESYSNFVRKIIIVCCGFVTFGICFGALNFCIHFGSNIGLLTRGGGIFLGYSLVFLKVFLIGYYQTELQKLKDTVSSCFAEDLKNPENRPHLLVYFPTIKTFFYIFNYFLLANNVVMTTMPLSSLRQGKYIRALPNIPPFSYEPGGTAHWLLYSFEMLSFFFLWSVTCGVDSFFGYYTLHMVGEFRLLSVRFAGMKSSGEYKKELKEYVDRHNQLIECQRILEKIFGFVAIWLGVTCAVSLCTLIWQLSTLTNLSKFRVCFVINYSVIKMLQAFSYSWFGSIITSESKRCLDSMYSAQWHIDGDERFMNDALIILSQRSLTFNAKGLMTLDMNMFQKIVNTSVSYFFLLQTLEEAYEL